MSVSKEIDAGRTGLSKSLMTTTLDRLFVRSQWEGECRVWLGARNDRGYGQIVVDGKVLYAHRVAWEIEHGPIPAGLYVCHRCDNPPCFRPTHLFLGTNAENQQDAVAKGRRPRGEAHPRHRLSEDDVAFIGSYAGNQRELAERLGVSQSLVSLVRSNKRRVAA